ncbi:MAG: ATP-NAD kinase [Dehalococcoidia bacterium]|nr:ATP-NAD kinase [Dehalococcoidia bacterium]
MITVGIIANPAAGKDIRRLVAHGRVVSNQEKANTLRRVFAGLVASGVERILVMPDMSGLARPAAEDNKGRIKVEYLDMAPAESQHDSTRAARAMADQGVKCIITLGGDGTNRVVAKGCRESPIVPISTGTNNVFPQMVEGTLAGLAAGAVATGAAPLDKVSRRSKTIEIFVDGKATDIALVDAAVTYQAFVGARAVWQAENLAELFLTRAEPASIGLSSVGSRLRPVEIDEPHGLYIRLSGEPGHNATTVRAPVAPGVISDIEIKEWSLLKPGDRYEVTVCPGTVALDGEREVELLPRHKAEIALSMNGPRVVDVALTHALLAATSAAAVAARGR